MSRKAYGCRWVRGHPPPEKFENLDTFLSHLWYLGTPLEVLFVDNFDPFSSAMVIKFIRGRIAFRSGTRTTGRASCRFRLL